MPYTVWSDDRLIGKTELDYVANTSEIKFGDFEATEYGQQVIPVLMAPRQAVCAHAPHDQIEALQARRETVQLELRAPDGRLVPTDYIEITDLEWLLSLTPPSDMLDDDWRADLELAEWELREELEPEMPVEDELKDLLPPECLEHSPEPGFDEFDVPDLEFGVDPESPREFPRYQIQVGIKNGG